MQQFEEQPAFTQWLGQGWGATVQFGFETASTKANFSRTNAPFLHNGYAYYLMKVGIVGLLLYIGFLCHLALRATTKTEVAKRRLRRGPTEGFAGCSGCARRRYGDSGWSWVPGYLFRTYRFGWRVLRAGVGPRR